MPPTELQVPFQIAQRHQHNVMQLKRDISAATIKIHRIENWGDYLITCKERRTRGSHDFKFIVPKGHKDIFRFSFFPRTITEWNKLPEETVSSQSLCIFKSKLI